jgi:hypothetical protein
MAMSSLASSTSWTEDLAGLGGGLHVDDSGADAGVRRYSSTLVRLLKPFSVTVRWLFFRKDN